MAAPTSITVSVDKTEYSRYERQLGNDKIIATVVLTGGAPYTNEDIRVELIKARRSRDAVVASHVETIVVGVDPYSFTVEFYLPDIVDQDLISLVRHGQFFVKATSDTDDDVFGSSADFPISIVTAERLKKDFLFGLDLQATDQKEPKFQPKSISGISVVEVSKSHPVGFGTLSYSYTREDVSDASAVIGSGTNGTVTVNATAPNTGSAGNGFLIEVVVPVGTSGLSANLVGNTITVSLAVTAGVPDAGPNQAENIRAAIDALTGFSATVSGTGVDSITTAEGPTQFTGGVTNENRTLSWRGGESVAINAAGTYILGAGVSGPAAACGLQPSVLDYISVRVSSVLLLPTSSVSENLLIEQKVINEDTLRGFVEEATAWLENDALNIHVEPTNVVTDRNPSTIQYSAGVNAPTPIFTDTDYDFVVSPLTYFIPTAAGGWVQIQTPHPQILRVDNLFGAIANTRVIDIDLEWIEIANQSGLIQLVPFNQEIAFDFIGLIWVNATRGASVLPNFWHYNALVGLRDCPPDLREVIAKKAAINALVIAGHALKPGLGSISLSRDGVSESLSLNSSTFGNFSATIQAYKDWIEQNLGRYKAKYKGATMVVL